MPFIPRQVKEPPPFVFTCRLPQAVATSLKQYVEFADSPREYVVTEILRHAFRRDKEFRAWLVLNYPNTPMSATESLTAAAAASGRTHANSAAKTTAVTARQVPTAPGEHPPRTDHEPLARQDRRTP
jgi:hypothetical protein